MLRISRARGPLETNRRPCCPSADQGSSDHGLPERSGSQGIDVPGKICLFRRWALWESERIQRRNTTRSDSPTAATVRPAVTTGQATSAGTQRPNWRDSLVTVSCAASPTKSSAPYPAVPAARPMAAVAGPRTNCLLTKPACFSWLRSESAALKAVPAPIAKCKIWRCCGPKRSWGRLPSRLSTKLVVAAPRCPMAWPIDTFAAVTHHGRGSKDGDTAAHVASSAPKIPADIWGGNVCRLVMRTTGVRSATTPREISAARLKARFMVAHYPRTYRVVQCETLRMQNPAGRCTIGSWQSM